MNNKRKQWLLAVKELAEEKLSTNESNSDETSIAIKTTGNRNLITWMLFGAVSAIFISAYLDVFKENTTLKAKLAEIKSSSPYQKTNMKVFDFYEPLPELPPTYENHVDERNSTPVNIEI